MALLELLEEKDVEAKRLSTAEPMAFEVDGLHASYGGKPALRGLSCRIRERRVTAIVGPSGCGKSTLIKSLNRALELTPGAAVTAGHVRFRGCDLYDSA